jgi:hypothetical protein
MCFCKCCWQLNCLLIETFSDASKFVHLYHFTDSKYVWNSSQFKLVDFFFFDEFQKYIKNLNRENSKTWNE